MADKRFLFDKTPVEVLTTKNSIHTKIQSYKRFSLKNLTCFLEFLVDVSIKKQNNANNINRSYEYKTI